MAAKRKKKPETLYEALTKAINYYVLRGWDSPASLMEWNRRLRAAANRETPRDDATRKHLTTIYRRLVIDGGALREQPADGPKKITLEKIKPDLRKELEKRIFASAELIRLNREQAIERTLQRFSGWDKEQIPAGVEVSNTKEGLEMHEEQLKALIAQITQGVSGSLSTKIDAVTARMDSLEQGIKARADGTAAAEEKRRADEAAAAEEEKTKNDSDMGAAYAKADSAFTGAGKSAPMPFAGEKALDYRKRALIAMQSHSPAHKDVNIRAIADSATLSVLEDAIYGAAKEAIDNEMKNSLGTLHKRVRSDEAGRRITEYQGDPNVWLAPFKTPARVMVQGSLNNKGH
mgnify:CR=1 FL=1